MAQQKTFRTALNGFNREDVVSYIEYLNSVHAAEINQLNTELNFFQNKQPEAACVPESAEAYDDQQNDVLKQQAARIRELFDCCRELEEKLAAAEEAKARAEEEKAHVTGLCCTKTNRCSISSTSAVRGTTMALSSEGETRYILTTLPGTTPGRFFTITVTGIILQSF